MRNIIIIVNFHYAILDYFFIFPEVASPNPIIFTVGSSEKRQTLTLRRCKDSILNTHNEIGTLGKSFQHLSGVCAPLSRDHKG
jgi:hypothetical protein